MAEPATTTTGIYCKQCGYDLRASQEAGRCPECGRAFSPDDPRSFRPRPFAAPWKRALGRWAKRLAILLLVLVVLFAGLWGWLYWGWKQEQAVLAELDLKIGLSDHAVEGGRVGSWIHAHDLPGSFVLVRVTYLCLGDTATDADLLPLRKLVRLEELILCCPRITDAGMAHLRECPRLRRLELLGAGITDAGLEPLAHCPALGEVCLLDTQVTPAGAKRLKAARPGCTIYGP